MRVVRGELGVGLFAGVVVWRVGGGGQQNFGIYWDSKVFFTNDFWKS